MGVHGVMASGHVLRSVVFLTFIEPHLTHKSDEIRLSILDDHACSIYIANNQITSPLKELQPAMPRRPTNIGSCFTSTSKRLQITIFFVKNALLAEICSSLLLLSCGDIISNLGPNGAAP